MPARCESARSGGVLAWLLPLLMSSLSISSRVRLLSEINFYSYGNIQTLVNKPLKIYEIKNVFLFSGAYFCGHFFVFRG
jgi:hypothetical protein